MRKTSILQWSLLIVFLNVGLYKIFRSFDRKEIYVKSHNYGGRGVRLGALCKKTKIIGAGPYSPGYGVCDAENFLQLYAKCIMLRIVDEERRHSSDDFKLDYERLLRWTEQGRCSHITLKNTSSSTAIRDYLIAQDLGLRVPLARFDSGVMGAKLLLNSQIGVYICQVLVTLRASSPQISRFVLRMKMRSYRLFSSIKWRYSWEREEGGAGKVRWIYNLSFIHTHCILGEKRPDYDFEQLWEFE